MRESTTLSFMTFGTHFLCVNFADGRNMAALLSLAQIFHLGSKKLRLYNDLISRFLLARLPYFIRIRDLVP